MRLTLLFLVALVVALAVVLILASVNAGRVDVLAAQGIPPGVEIAQIDYVHGGGSVSLLVEQDGGSEDLPELPPTRTYTLHSVDHPDLVRRVVHALRHSRAVRPRAWVMEAYVILLTAEDSRRVQISLARAQAGEKKTAYVQNGQYRSDELERVLSEIEQRGIGFSMRRWRYKPTDKGN